MHTLLSELWNRKYFDSFMSKSWTYEHHHYSPQQPKTEPTTLSFFMTGREHLIHFPSRFLSWLVCFMSVFITLYLTATTFTKRERVDVTSVCIFFDSLNYSRLGVKNAPFTFCWLIKVLPTNPLDHILYVCKLKFSVFREWVRDQKMKMRKRNAHYLPKIRN